MIPLTSVIEVVLRCAALCLPAGRREWAEAVRAEAANVPAGRARMEWLIGGLWLVAREVGMIRKVGPSAMAVGAIVVWLNWHPGSANPAMPTNRFADILIVLVLAALPWLVRGLLGPVADNRVARIVRIGGYTALYALLLVMAGLSRFASSRFDHMKAFDQNNWDADMRSGAIVSAVLVITVIGGYAATILVITARRSAVAPGTLAIGAGSGVVAALTVYALAPLGNARHFDSRWLVAGYGIALALVPLGALLAAGVLAGRRNVDRRLGDGTIAGLCAGGTAAILLNILTIGTMLLLPRQVDLEWANPDPNVAHGTADEIQMSVGDAAIKYEFGLLLGPLLGLVAGVIGGVALAGADEAPLPRRRDDPALSPATSSTLIASSSPKGN